jgi:hypothetical protein
MKIRGIPFSRKMVHEVLANRKTVTRRVVVPQPPDGFYVMRYDARDDGYRWERRDDGLVSYWPGDDVRRCPYGVEGDLLYVREAWGVPDDWTMEDRDVRFVIYKADVEPTLFRRGLQRWRPSIHMPKWATRIWLRVTASRCERLASITSEECKREGLVNLARFREGWDELNGDRGYGFDVDPWVWRIGFERCEAPVDFLNARDADITAAKQRRGR